MLDPEYDDDEERPTRASSPDTCGSDGAGRGAALVKRPWTPEEDALLMAAVHKYGACRWSMIATQLSSGRVGKQCRERWNNHLCPEVKKSEWSEQEDRAILEGVAVLGTRWCEIIKAPALSGRTDNAIKNRFYSLQRRMKARQPGAHRSGRRGPANAESDEEEKPLTQVERIMAVATELAFATDEIERDKLIEQLTDACHTDDACDPLGDSSELGDALESPTTAAGLASLGTELDHAAAAAAAGQHMAAAGATEGAHAAPPPCSHERSMNEACEELFREAPTPLPIGGFGQHRAATTDSSGGFGGGLALNINISSEALGSVAAVADLLHLPHSPREGLSAPRLLPTAASHLPSPAATDSPTDMAHSETASTASTVSPDGAGGAAGLDEDAWRVPDAKDAAAKQPGAGSPTKLAGQPAQPLGQPLAKPLQPLDCDVAPVRKPAPTGVVSTMVVATGTKAVLEPPPRLRHALADESNTLLTNGSGGLVALGEVSPALSVGTTLLGGRQLYRASLPPLCLPPEPPYMGEGISPLSEASDHSVRRVSSGDDAAPAAAAPAATAAGGERRGAVAGGGGSTETGTEAPSLELQLPTSPMSELLSLSIFTDLFAEEQAAAQAASLAPTPTVAKAPEATAVAADGSKAPAKRPRDADAAAAEADAVPSPAVKRSRRQAERMASRQTCGPAGVTAEGAAKHVRFSASVA